MAKYAKPEAPNRRLFIGGSDARVIMGSDEAALHRLWQEKRGEVEPRDLSRDLLVQLGSVTEDLNRRWFEQETKRHVSQVQHHVGHPSLSFMAATLDGLVQDHPAGPAVYEAKFMLPFSFSEEAAAEQAHGAAPALHAGDGHETRVSVDHHRGGQVGADRGGGDPLYQTVLLQVERIFWRCVQQGEVPRPFGAEPPRPGCGCSGGGHERVQRLGGVGLALPQDPGCSWAARECEGGAEEPCAGGCPGGVRARGESEALQSRGRHLRAPEQRGRLTCSCAVTALLIWQGSYSPRRRWRLTPR
jgi:hypothetical protein